jgi:hypothetical protein
MGYDLTEKGSMQAMHLECEGENMVKCILKIVKSSR